MKKVYVTLITNDYDGLNYPFTFSKRKFARKTFNDLCDEHRVTERIDRDERVSKDGKIRVELYEVELDQQAFHGEYLYR